MIKGPCKVYGIDCPNRTTTCRNDCEYWKVYKAELARIKEARIKDKTSNHVYWQTRNKNKAKSRKGASTYYVY